MRVLVTGADGFIGKHLFLHLNEMGFHDIVKFIRQDCPDKLPDILNSVDWVIHLAGENRPQDKTDFELGNAVLTEALCEAIKKTGKNIPLIFTSSTKAANDCNYGRSKLKAEASILSLKKQTGNDVYITRLPNVFGKWCRPNYNSAVATFCHNIARGLPININEAEAPIDLIFIEDVIKQMVALIFSKPSIDTFLVPSPVYSTTVGALADYIRSFHESRKNLFVEQIGSGFLRALYSTYVSYLPTESFSYPLGHHQDERGTFVEILKTKCSGQISFFTAHEGVTRGGHYHHSKTEKFVVIQGHARFRFRNVVTNAFHEIFTSNKKFEIVETIPGWAHDVTNVGSGELVCVLWANEIFDNENPDTVFSQITSDA